MNKEENNYFYFDLPMYVITNFFHGGSSVTRKYKNDYICGEWYIDYRFKKNSMGLVPKESFLKYGDKFISLLVNKDNDFENFLYEKYLAIVKLADDLHKINKREIGEGAIPNKEKFYDQYAEIFPDVIGIGYSIDMALDEYVKAEGIDLLKIKIPKDSFILREKRELKKIAEIEDDEEREKRLKDHALEYSFLLNNYIHFQPAPIDYFRDRLEKVKKEVIPENNFTIIAKPKNINEWLGFFIYIRDERKRCNMLFNGLYLRYLQRECKKHNLIYEDAIMLMPDEFEKQKFTGKLKNYNGRRIIKTDRQKGMVDISPETWDEMYSETISTQKIIKGSIASKGVAQGVAKIILSSNDFYKLKEGEIIVSSMTRPEFMPVITKAAAIITNEGGVTCHAAIISRELNKPCITSTNIATKLIKDGDLVKVDADHGIVEILKRNNI